MGLFDAIFGKPKPTALDEQISKRFVEVMTEYDAKHGQGSYLTSCMHNVTMPHDPEIERLKRLRGRQDPMWRYVR